MRRYLEALEAQRDLNSSTTTLNAHLALLELLLADADPQARLQLERQRHELRRAPAIGTLDELAEAEAAFIAVARSYSEDEAITYAAWQEAGVEPRVLRAAGLAPVSRRLPPAPACDDVPCPKPLLRCWLLLLVGETPRHGYMLCEALVAAQVGPVDAAGVYRMLRHLDDDALVASQWQTSTRPAPERRVYSLTPAGETVLDACAACVVELRNALRCRTGRPPR